MPSSSVPVIRQFSHCRGVGSGTPRQTRNANIKPPAIGKRIAAIRNGGKPSSAMRIAR
jgi:hypothetical protein